MPAFRTHHIAVAAAIAYCLGSALLPNVRAQVLAEPQAIVAVAAAHPVTYPSLMMTRLLRILKGEWEEGGNFIIRADGTTENDAAPSQGAPPAFGRIQSYWNIFETRRDYVNFNRALLAQGKLSGSDAKTYCGKFFGADSDPHIWGCDPWSAAFVSWVFQTTGVLQSEFPRAEAHRDYIDALLKIHLNEGSKALFKPKNNGSYKPALGDLICSDRTKNPSDRLRKFEDRIVELGKKIDRPMHCDIVSGVGPNEVKAIGGNVRDRVAKATYTIDASNQLKGYDRDAFVIFENRIGQVR